jgi:hypothetical protein
MTHHAPPRSRRMLPLSTRPPSHTGPRSCSSPPSPSRRSSGPASACSVIIRPSEGASGGIDESIVVRRDHGPWHLPRHLRDARHVRPRLGPRGRLSDQYRWFVESVYVLISLPLSQRSFGSRMGDLRPAHPTHQARRRAFSRKWPMRKMFDAIFYLLRSGCQWRMLPREFPPWSTVHHYFRMWRLDGT